MTPPATRALAATLAIGLCACTPVRRGAAGEYGPPADQLEMAPAPAPAITRLPPSASPSSPVERNSTRQVMLARAVASRRILALPR